MKLKIKIRIKTQILQKFIDFIAFLLKKRVSCAIFSRVRTFENMMFPGKGECTG